MTKEWRCFHCDELFTDRDAAADHFGWNEYGAAACRVDGGLAHAYRVQENELRRSREEDTDLHRSLWSLGAKAEVARREWGDKEYARGVAAGRGFPEGDYLVVPKDCTDEMKAAYSEAIYFTTDSRIMSENIWRAMCEAALKPPTAEEVAAVQAA